MLILRAGFYCRRVVSRLRDRAVGPPSLDIPLSVTGGDDGGDDGDDGQGGNGSALEVTPPSTTDGGGAVSDGHEEYDPAEPEVIRRFCYKSS